MKISTFILLSFIFILLLFSFTTYINYRLSEQVRENAEFLSRSTEIVRSSSRFQRNTINMVSGLRGFLLTGERYFIEAYDSAAAENESILKEVVHLTDDTSQIRLLNEIQALHEQWVEGYTEPLRQAKLLASIDEKNITAFNKLYREKTAGEKSLQLRLQAKFREFANQEYKVRDERRALLAVAAKRANVMVIVLTGISMLAALLVVTVLISRISRRIKKMVNMADTIASGNYNVNLEDKGNDELTALAESLNHMAQELSTNISLLKEKNEELDQFAHIVSHDLKGPLRGIDNVVSWIEEDHQSELTPKLAEYLQLIKGRVIRTENLIHGILSYARIGKEIVPKEPVDVNELLEEVKDSLPADRDIRILIPERLPVIPTERIPLFQVFANLVSNAVKYNDKEHGEIKIFYRDSGEKYEFFVQDNGPGIPDQYHKRIFIIFQTLKERDSFESTGVGLAIVKKILDKRNERISVSSVPGEGATFSFTWSKH
ncbi:MAG TPA: ATP-binding protein [Chitinophagaceae bacterium]